MRNHKNKVIISLTTFAIVIGATLSSPVVEANTTKTEAKAQLPIVFEGDNLSFNDLTGEVYAKGNVKITQDSAVLMADHIRGNTKQGDVWIDDKANFLERVERVNLVGTQTHYNYQSHTGTMLEVTGKVDKEHLTGNQLEFLPDKYIVHNGTMTKCPAIVPDYHISASKIEIWPDDKLIAYNVKFWIKNKVLYSMPKYQKDLTKEGGSAFPSIGYDSDNGVYIRQHLEYPLTNKISAYGDLAYYSKVDFKPAIGLVDRERNYTIGIHQGYFEDDDGVWIKKEPEFRFNYHSKPLGKLPVNYTFSAVYGKWTDDYKSSWHQNYLLYFTHNPIKLNDSMNLYLGTGYEITRESYNKSTVNSYKYDITLTKAFSPKLNSWVGYHYTQNKANVFEYQSDSLSRELNFGATYRFDKLNAFTYSQRYDLDNKTSYDQDYTWHRNLHCWNLDITYRAERSQVKVKLHTLAW